MEARMTDELVFYTNPMSRGRIVRWMLEEVGQPYRTEVVDYGGVKSPAYLAINPMGKVPALVHGNALVTETPAICAYLADAFPEARLAPPAGDPRRGAYYRWLFFAAGPLEAAVTNQSLGWEVPPERQRMAGYGSYRQTLDVVEQALTGREYVAGGSFTAADLYLGSHLNFGLAFGTMEKRPAFEAYVARLRSRPAFRRANELDDALAGRQPA
jgi:glutathione S-transferase